MLKKAIIVLLPLALAVVIALQATSLALAGRLPDVAAAIWPGNGLALAQKATIQMSLEAQSTKNVSLSARRQLVLARRAYRFDPLSTKAMAIFVARTEGGCGSQCPHGGGGPPQSAGFGHPEPGAGIRARS